MASNDFPIGEAQIVSLFMEAVLYGIYLTSFAALIRALVFGGDAKVRINKLMFTAAILFSIFATLGVSFQLRHVLDAFIWYRGPGGADAEFEEISNPVNVMQTVCYALQTFIGDLILIYRCWIVYNRRWVVIAFPLLVWLGTVVSGCSAMYVEVHLKVSANLDEKHLVPFILSFSVLTMVQNLATTILIAWRIWSIDQRVSQYKSGNRLKPVLKMIIESGAIYTLSLIVFLAVFLSNNNAQYAVSVATEQIIGIVFNLLIIRVHQGRAMEQVTSVTMQSRSGPDEFVPAQTASSLGKTQFRSRTNESYAMEPVQVKVTKQVARDVDEDSTFGDNIAHSEEKHSPVP